MHVSEIETPALVVDLDRMERNLARAAEYAQQHGLRLRPHTKTHKSVRIGRRQLESGAAGLTVAKVSEAGVMVDASPSALLLYHSPRHEGLTEIRPGTYIYNDVNTVLSGACALEDCAATILSTVVSTARAGHMIIDGGAERSGERRGGKEGR